MTYANGIKHHYIAHKIHCFLSETVPFLNTTCSHNMSHPVGTSDLESLPKQSINDGNFSDDHSSLPRMPLEQEATDSSSFWNASRRKSLVQASYLGIGAILGTLLRMTLAQVFGEECANPGTVGWIADDSALCVTKDGETSLNGGIIFADLPANVLGSFIMGLMQDGKNLDLAVHAPVAWLSPKNSFQSYDIFHLAIKTGFCGSLTTFSSWNSEMVVMMLGEEATHLHSQVWKALFGYIVGIETALGSYVFGRTVALWLHRWRNPLLAEESRAMKVRRSQGVHINQSLPEFERRFLPDLPMSTVVTDLDVPNLAFLERWKTSTRQNRRVDDGTLALLDEIEESAFIDQGAISVELQEEAKQYGWDIAALLEYTATRPAHLSPDSRSSAAGIRKTVSDDSFSFFRLPVAISLWSLCLAMLLFLIVYFDDESTSYIVTYRTMVYAMFFSTPGALLRWKLGAWFNGGKVQWLSLGWLPVGTFAANILGSAISISMTAAAYRLNGQDTSGFWVVGTLRAIKTGFSGCLTTVSTFISEVHGMTQTLQDRAYKYIALTLGTACLLSMMLYCIIVYV